MDEDLSDFDDFKPASVDGIKSNRPGVRSWGSQETFLRSDVKLLKPKKDDDSIIRLIPIPKFGSFAKKVLLHYNFGTDTGSIGCPQMFGLPISACPMCLKSLEFYKTAQGIEDKTEREAVRDLGYRFKAKEYWLSFCIDRKKEDEGVQIFQYPDSTYQDICNLIRNRKTGKVRSLDALRGGHDLLFTKRKDGGKQYYTIRDLQLDEDATDLADTPEKIREICEYVRSLCPIEDLINRKDKEQMFAVMSGSESAAEPGMSEEDYEDDKPSSSSKGHTQEALPDENEDDDDFKATDMSSDEPEAKEVKETKEEKSEGLSATDRLRQRLARKAQ